jgi:hypothetical protein
MMAVPRISAGCASRIASSVSLATHSMKPLPSVLVEMRNVRTSSSNATRSTIAALVAREWISEPPTDSKKPPEVSTLPVRCSAIWLAPPVATF